MTIYSSQAVKDCFDCVPVMGALAEAVQRVFEKPVFVLLCVMVANGWFNNCDLVVWENALAKGILAVTLFECVLSFDGHAD
jgi:hypothetical protein